MNLDELKVTLPNTLKGLATQELLDKINNASTDPIIAENIRDNFISYSSVLTSGKFKVEDYLNAVKYVSYRLMGNDKQTSYFKTFPDRHQALIAKGTTPKDMSAYVHAYDANKIVALVYEQSMIPVWIVNQGNVQKAINTLVDVMANSKSDIARVNAANSLIVNLAPPKESGPTVHIDMRNNSGLDDLKNTLLDLAKMTQGLIIDGSVTTKSIAEHKLVKGVTDVN